MNDIYPDNNFCIIMSKYRLLQGLALYKSLENNMKRFTLFILCMDESVSEAVEKLQLNGVAAIPVSKLEDSRLKRIKTERALNEYCWTLKPHFIEFILSSYPEINRVTYLDADLFFFASPEKLLSGTSSCSVLLSKHNYSEAYAQLTSACGKYNSGFISFSKEKSGMKCLNWWKGKCIDWCEDKALGGKFGDQKYLEHMSSLSSRVCSINTPGTNIAPWNQAGCRFTLRGNDVYINNDRLIFYHFCGFRLLSKDKFALVIGQDTGADPAIYKPYITAIVQCIGELEEKGLRADYFYIEERFSKTAKIYETQEYL